jgi:hypothetical protein
MNVHQFVCYYLYTTILYLSKILVCTLTYKTYFCYDIIYIVRTQFSKDDVDASDSLLARLFDDDFNGDDGVWVD